MPYNIPEDDVVGGPNHVLRHTQLAQAINDIDTRFAGVQTQLDGKISNYNNEATLQSGTDFFAKYYITDEGASADWPNRLEFWFTPANPTTGGPAHRTAFFNEYGEIRCTPGRPNTVPFRIFTKEYSSFPARNMTVPIIEVTDDRNNRNTLFAVYGDGKVEAPNIGNKIVTVPTGTSGWSSQPDGTLWVEYTP